MAFVERSLPLFPEATVESPGSIAIVTARVRPASLWLALHLPSLPLEIFAGAAKAGPLAVIEQQGSRQRLVALNDCAARHGLEAGQPLTGAYALAPALEVLERNPRAERTALERLAAWAGRFTSAVSVEAPAALLLEVRGSLRLFGGLDALCKEILDGLATLGHAAERGIAPTPLAALWLARAGDTVPVGETHLLAGRLGRLPLSTLGWPAKTQALLHEMGLRRVKDCLRLPRDGFARRLGPELLAELDRALGRSPDPRASFASPPRFAGELELPAEICDTNRLLDGAARLLEALGSFLCARQGGVRSVELELVHGDCVPSSLELRLSGPSRDPRHLRELLAERLERLQLPAPVRSLRLRSGAVRPLDAVDRPLLRDACKGDAREALPRLIERLRARFGEEAVYGLRLAPDHRPEAAWRRREPTKSGPESGSEGNFAPLPNSFSSRPTRNCLLTPISRPLWMLVEPQCLSQSEGRLSWQGSLTIEGGPERIETGWWDGGDVARDYYVATNPRGMRLWIFRQRRGRRHWFLHGIFG